MVNSQGPSFAHVFLDFRFPQFQTHFFTKSIFKLPRNDVQRNSLQVPHSRREKRGAMSSCLPLYIGEEFSPKVLPRPLPRPFYISQVRPGSSAYSCPGKGEERLRDEFEPVIMYFLELETLTLLLNKTEIFLQGKGGVRWLWVSNQQCL